MAGSGNESRLVTPFMPSLQHCASVKIAVLLFQESGVKIFEEAFTEIEAGDLSTPERNSCKNCRAKESLLNIPDHLRLGVMEALRGMKNEASRWIRDHDTFKKEVLKLHWRSDGSIDVVKTAQNLAHNEKFTLKERFKLACKYFLVESVQSLWEKMEITGKAKSFKTRHGTVARCWVQWLRQQPRVSWTLSVGTWIHAMPNVFGDPSDRYPRCSAFFPLLRPEERQKFFEVLDFTQWDDLRFCFYAITKDEEQQILSDESRVSRLLFLHLEWPLQTLFLDTVGKMWNHIDNAGFHNLVGRIFISIEDFHDFNYSKLFEDFWSASPLHLKESAREDRYLGKKIDSFFENRRRKEESAENS